MINTFIKNISKNITKPVLVLDIETTGTDTKTDETIQFAGIKIHPDGSKEELSFLCKPSKPIPKEASDVHGITNEQVKNEETFEQHAEQLSQFIEGADVAGYNLANYDIVILDRQMEQCGYVDIFEKSYIYDAYTVFCKECSRKLTDAVRYYTGKEIEDAHDALGDVKSTIAVMATQLKNNGKDLTTMASEVSAKPEDRIGISKYIIFNEDKEPILNFSQKNKGKKLSDVDEGFLLWILKNDFPKKTKAFIKKHLAERKNGSKNKTPIRNSVNA